MPPGVAGGTHAGDGLIARDDALALHVPTRLGPDLQQQEGDQCVTTKACSHLAAGGGVRCCSSAVTLQRKSQPRTLDNATAADYLADTFGWGTTWSSMSTPARPAFAKPRTVRFTFMALPYPVSPSAMIAIPGAACKRHWFVCQVRTSAMQHSAYPCDTHELQRVTAGGALCAAPINNAAGQVQRCGL